MKIVKFAFFLPLCFCFFAGEGGGGGRAVGKGVRLMNYSAVEVTFDKRLLSELMFVNLCHSSLLTFSFLMNLVKEITKIISYSFTAESSYQVSSFCYFKSFSKFLVSCGASIDFHPPSEHCVTLLY